MDNFSYKLILIIMKNVIHNLTRHLAIIGLFSNGIGKNEWCTIFYIYKETKAKESEITVPLIESFYLKS